MKRTRIMTVLLPIALACAPPTVLGLPDNGRIVSGDAELELTDDSTLTIRQDSKELSLDFDSFNISSDELVEFLQPGADSLAVNRVIGASPSQIMGALKANGQVFLSNPNGIVFGQGAHVDVGGLVATTLDIAHDPDEPMQWRLAGDGAGAGVTNEGHLLGRDGGYVHLIAQTVSNNGRIEIADGGESSLTSADQVVLRRQGEHVGVAMDQAAVKGLVENHGEIIAPGGVIRLQARASERLQETVISNTGDLRANSLEQRNGEVWLTSSGEGDIWQEGRIDVSGEDAAADGGYVDIQGQRVAQTGTVRADGAGVGNGGNVRVRASDELVLASSAETSANAGVMGNGGDVTYIAEHNALFQRGAGIDARGGSGGGNGGFVEFSGLEWVEALGQVNTLAPAGMDGRYLIDPTDISISNATNSGSFDGTGNWTTAGPTSQIDTADITSQLATTNVVIDSNQGTGGAGNITVDAPIDLNGGNGRTLTLTAAGTLNVKFNICDGGNSCAATPDDSVNLNLESDTSLSIDDGVRVDAGNSKINLSGGTGLAVTGVETRSSAADAVSIQAGGAITESGDILTDIKAPNGGVQFDADIGAAGLAMEAASLDLLSTGGGSFDFNLSGGFELADVDTAGDVVLAANGGGINVSGFTQSGKLDLSAANGLSIQDGVLLDAGTGTISLDAGGDIALTGLLSSAAAPNAVTVNAGGQISRGGNSETDISAVNGGMQLQATGGINDLQTDTLEASIINTGSGDVSVTNAGPLDVSALETPALAALDVGGDLTLPGGLSATDLTLTASGAIVAPDTGLTVGGNLTLAGDDLRDSDRSVELAADQLRLDLASPAGDVTLNTQVNEADIAVGAGGSLDITESSGLRLLDLDADGDAVIIDDGNLSLLVENGDLVVDDRIQASDATGDGVRSGLIDIALGGGGISIGANGPATIRSRNTVDAAAGGGLGSDGTSQLALRIRQTDGSNTSADFELGNGAGNDVLLEALGGDLSIDSGGGVTLTDGNTRNLSISQDVTVAAFDAPTDPQSGEVRVGDGVETNGDLIARQGRFIALRAGGAPSESPANSGLDNAINDVSPDSGDTGGSSAAAVSIDDGVDSPATSLFAATFPDCSGASADRRSRQCSVADALKEFLGQLLVNGALPE